MRLRVLADSANGSSALVEMDGVVRNDVMALTVSMNARELTTATVTYFVEELDLDVVAEESAELER